jgi:hypothetical protein
MSLPQWARKPTHKKEVEATARGWRVKETGEYLKLIKDLDAHLKELKVDLDNSLQSVSSNDEPEPVVTYYEPEKPAETIAQGGSEMVGGDEVVDEDETPPKKRSRGRGRPRKEKSAPYNTDTE